MLVEIYKKIPNWVKVGIVALLVGYFVGRNSIPVHTEKSTETITQVEQKQSEDTSKKIEESTTKITQPKVVIREEVRPDGTKIKETIKEGGTKEETKRKEEDNKKIEKEIKIVEVNKEVIKTQPLPSYSFGSHIKAPIDDIASNHLKKELDITFGYRTYKGLWLEGVVSSPLDFKKPMFGIGFRVEF